MLDLIIVPGVAFTPSGSRLGHGKGFYDKFFREYFKKHPNREKTKLIGLALGEQMLKDEDIPMEPHDFPIDIVLTSD
jgi:5-formyltetrahydrofolate cyclo-ligase